jgi:hypothetical protein
MGTGKISQALGMAHNVGWHAEFQGSQRSEKRRAMTPTAAAAGPVNGGQA